MAKATLISSIELSARLNAPVTLEGMWAAEAADLLASGVAELSEGDSFSAVLSGFDQDDRPYTVQLIDVYAYELEEV